MRKTGFTLIELLVVIVIIGILSTISTATFKSYFGKARDAERQAAVQNIALMVKVDGASKTGNDKYWYNDFTALNTLFETNDFRPPKGSNNICYYFASARGENTQLGDDNNFYIATWGETTSTLENGTAGVLVDGTELSVSSIISKGRSSSTPSKTDKKLDPIDFDCNLLSASHDLRQASVTGLELFSEPRQFLYINEDGAVKKGY